MIVKYDDSIYGTGSNYVSVGLSRSAQWLKHSLIKFEPPLFDCKSGQLSLNWYIYKNK